MKFWVVLMICLLGAANADEPIIISLGARCGTASTLAILKIRTSAYPFDWLVSPFDSLCAALEDNFAHFLSNCHPETEGIVDFYGFHFNHDFPKDAPYKEALPSVKQKYQRRIARFRNACLGPNKVIFIRAEEISQNEAIILRDLLMRKYPLLDFTLLAINENESFERPWNLYKIKNVCSFWNEEMTWKRAILSTIHGI